MRVVNVPMRFLVNLPFPTPLSRGLMLVFLTGRRTGRRYRQPVSYVRDGDTLLTPGGGRWTRNLVEGRPERIRLRGRDVIARPELVGDLDRIQRLLDVMIAAGSPVATFMRVRKGPDGRLEPEGVANALRYGFRVVRWHLDDGTAGDRPGRQGRALRRPASGR
jgi:hypothetical protein